MNDLNFTPLVTYWRTQTDIPMRSLVFISFGSPFFWKIPQLNATKKENYSDNYVWTTKGFSYVIINVWLFAIILTKVSTHAVLNYIILNTIYYFHMYWLRIHCTIAMQMILKISINHRILLAQQLPNTQRILPVCLLYCHLESFVITCCWIKFYITWWELLVRDFI